MTATNEDLRRAMREGGVLGSLIICLTDMGADPEPEIREGLHGPSVAVFGRARTYRYLLTRRWAPGRVMTWVMLNPSTADAWTDDPTISRCWRRAAADGFGGIAVINLFALRATDPRELRKHAAPVGPGNDACLRMFCQPGGTVVAAWGALGGARATGAASMLTASGAGLLCLGTTKGGEPKHPLYVPSAARLVPYVRDGMAA